MTKNDGGFAFPIPRQEFPDGRLIQVGDPGMSLRDYFAGQVLGAIIHTSYLADPIHTHAKSDSEEAYRWADAMIAARGE